MSRTGIMLREVARMQLRAIERRRCRANMGFTSSDDPWFSDEPPTNVGSATTLTRTDDPPLKDELKTYWLFGFIPIMAVEVTYGE